MGCTCMCALVCPSERVVLLISRGAARMAVSAEGCPARFSVSLVQRLRLSPGNRSAFVQRRESVVFRDRRRGDALMRREHAPVIILGAGPAGLTAAYELSQNGVRSIVLEQDSVVGGLARTVEYKGCRFDIGGHRFYTKVPYIEKIWKEVLGEDLLVRPRLSRIYYRSKFFRYPLEPRETLAGLGPAEALCCFASFMRARLAPSYPENDFETWISNRFGHRLFETFFKSYTEKVWG